MNITVLFLSNILAMFFLNVGHRKLMNKHKKIAVLLIFKQIAVENPRVFLSTSFTPSPP